jgi:hypothetical protein
MSKALDSGKAFLEAVLAKLPENLRESARATFTAPEAADALTAVGDGVLARSDYSRSMDEINAKEAQITEDYEKLNAWYAENKDTLAKVPTLEAELAKRGGTPPPDIPPKEPPVTGLSREDLDKVLEDRDRNYAGVLAYTNTLTAKHLNDFKEVLDVQGVIDHAQKNKVSLDQSYRTLYAEKIAAKLKAEDDARINKTVEERLAEERKKFSDQPFPLRNTSPSVLDILEAPTDKPANHTVDTAVAEYERLTAARG